MKDKSLKKRVVKANKRIFNFGLVFNTWGNASLISSYKEFIYIKPSGVDFNRLTTKDISKVSLNGILQSGLKPSVDTPIHLELYKGIPEIGGVVHTHSNYATIFAQSGMSIPCFGTTHADYFLGEIPITEELTKKEINKDYEKNIGKKIIECFKNKNLNPLEISAVLIPCHGPFVWGETLEKAVENAIVLEKVAELAYKTLQLSNQSKISKINKFLFDKHFLRKHGKDKYYGQ